LLKVLKFVFYTVIYRHKIRKELNLPFRYGPGSWAVVTGGSEGCGRGIAMALAKRNFNIYLVSRTESRLQECARLIKETHPRVEVRILPFDFSVKKTPEDYREMYSKHFQGMDVSILVNNVGTYDKDNFHQASLEMLDYLIALNINAITFLSRVFLPNFMLRQKRSLFINLSSIVSYGPFAGQFVYNASKIFDDYFSRGLYITYKDKIDSISVKPGKIRPFPVLNLLLKQASSKQDSYLISMTKKEA
jgi:17beta-estradiol 17-dehydrogenase / very-long-chain 3-oxoacyl-CoA reductase